MSKTASCDWRPRERHHVVWVHWQYKPLEPGAHVGDAAGPTLFGVPFVEPSNISTFGDPEGFIWETAHHRGEITYQRRSHVEVLLRWLFNNQGYGATWTSWTSRTRLSYTHQHALPERNDGHRSGVPLQEKRYFLCLPAVRHVPHSLLSRRHSHAEEPVSRSGGAVLSENSSPAVSCTRAPWKYTCLHAHLQRHRSQEIPLSFYW